MTGEELYELWTQSNLKLNMGVDLWNDVDQEEWNQFAVDLDDFYSRFYND